MRFLKNPKEKCPVPGSVFAIHPLIHQDGQDFDQEKDVDRKGMLVHDPKNPLMFKHDLIQPVLYKKAKRMKAIGYLNSQEKIAASMKRIDARISFFTKVEKDAMQKLEELTKGKGDQKELKKLKKLYEDYMSELNKQAAASETLFQADIDSRTENSHSAYFEEAVEYYKNKKKINDLFDRLEKSREEFLKKNAGEDAYNDWKKVLEDQRQQSREALRQIENENTTALERVKRACATEKARAEVESFTIQEFEKVKQNNKKNKTTKGSFREELRGRILDSFILTVNRDFSGAFVTELDRYKEDFNKRFKQAMTKGAAEEIKNLSREFAEKILPHVGTINPDEFDELNAEAVEKGYVEPGLVSYRRIKLNMLSVINNNTNTDYPLLKVGLDELKEKDPERYAEIHHNLSITDSALAEYILMSEGYSTETLLPTPDKIRDGVKVIASTQLQQMKTAIKQKGSK
ncbi:MAG: hypothetical protein K6F35_07285 [Lachnospiraceae bacterium]|nr:hypothetical protein [Lachnospiraceae bacterium]